MTTQSNDEQHEDQEDTSPKGLRDALDREKQRTADAIARANTLQSQLMQSAFTQLGLDPAKGIGKAMAKVYEGDPSYEAIRAYAEAEFDYVPPKTANPEQAKVVHEAQDRVEGALQAGGASVVVDDDSLESQIAKAEADLDWPMAMSLKMQKLQQG